MVSCPNPSPQMPTIFVAKILSDINLHINTVSKWGRKMTKNIEGTTDPQFLEIRPSGRVLTVHEVEPLISGRRFDPLSAVEGEVIS